MILDTNGLSALVDGDAALEPAIRKAVQLALPVIVSANTATESRTRAMARITKTG